MCVASTGYAFDRNPENGSIGLKLGFFRVRRVKESQQSKDGSIDTMAKW
jgi:hypothetical protein